jgi:putative transposase
MARPLRIEFEDAIYHLCARGNERQRIFRDDHDRNRFLALLERSLERYEVSVLGFVLLPNHFHLIAQTHQANLSRWMHWLMVSYTVYFNRRWSRSGHLFQGRYKSFLVGTGEGEHLLSLSRYVHLNPVRGKVLGQGTPAERRKELRGYRWSSYRSYAGLDKAMGWVEERLVLKEMGGRNRHEQRLRYRRFVEEGLLREVEKPWEAVRWQIVLGNESFVQRVKDSLMGAMEPKREITGLRQACRGGEGRAEVA